MNDGLEKILIGLGGGASTGVFWLARAIIRAVRSRKTENAEEIMRKELWGEVNTLRKLLNEATTAVIDWQAKYLSLLTKHENVADELNRTQERLSKIGRLLSSALETLNRIDVVKTHLGENMNLLAAQQELQQMKVEASVIRQQVGALNQLSV